MAHTTDGSIKTIQIDLREMHNGNPDETKELKSEEFDGFYETQMIIKNNIKQIKKHAKLITHYTEKYNLYNDKENISEYTDKIENIIGSNAIVVSQIQSLIKSELSKIAIMSPTSHHTRMADTVNPQHRAKGIFPSISNT